MIECEVIIGIIVVNLRIVFILIVVLEVIICFFESVNFFLVVKMLDFLVSIEELVVFLLNKFIYDL